MAVPAHIAIILDGNGRWATAKGMPRQFGHAQGSKNVEVILEEAHNLGVQIVTVYAFSTENWTRPKEEVDALMKIFRNYLKTCLKLAKKNDMRVEVIGDVSGFDLDIQERIVELQDKTADYKGIRFIVALNYGGRDEIRRAVKNIADDVLEQKISPEDISEDLISSYLDTKNIPDPDLMIRTSGEMRLSNFLMWQLAYTEFYFADVHWPDFSVDELHKAIASYENRKRRFGKVE